MKLVLIAFAMAAMGLMGLPSSSIAIVVESGDFVVEVQDLKDLAFGTGSGLYVAPTATERVDYNTLAATLLSGNVTGADTQATALDYDLVEFTDTISGRVFHGLRERLVGGAPTRGWGSYFLDLSFQADALVEVPHPLFDTNSWEIAANAFVHSGARGFQMTGAHRNANGIGTADVADLTNTIFHEVHTAWKMSSKKDGICTVRNPLSVTGTAGDCLTMSIQAARGIALKLYCVLR